MLRALILSFLVAPFPVAAKTLDDIIDEHILPGYARLAETTQALEEAAMRDCTPTSEALQSAYHAAFDAWIRVSHLRFGPSEIRDRAFALYFWPDPRGATQKTLGTLIRNEDPVAKDAAEFGTVAVVARGFFALEFLLFDETFRDAGSADYRCALIIAITRDMTAGSVEIESDWLAGYAELMRGAGQNDTYRSEEEALRQLFTALTTGLEFTSDVRLGRPMGTFDRPRPARAEARRSGRSLRHVILSLEATRILAAFMSGENPDLDRRFADALARAERLEDPVFAGVAEPGGRLRVEVLQQSINLIRQSVAEELGPSLGIAAGFNSLDGD